MVSGLFFELEVIKFYTKLLMPQNKLKVLIMLSIKLVPRHDPFWPV